MIADLKASWHFLTTRPFADTWTYLKRKDTPAKVQFLKYALVGATATALQAGISMILSHSVFPAIDQAMDPALRSRNLTINNGIGFLFSVVYGYILNANWIFTPGRHSRWLEATLFLVVSSIAFLSGDRVTAWLIKAFNLHTYLAMGGFIFTAVLVNYVCRKFIVFKK